MGLIAFAPRRILPKIFATAGTIDAEDEDLLIFGEEGEEGSEEGSEGVCTVSSGIAAGARDTDCFIVRTMVSLKELFSIERNEGKLCEHVLISTHSRERKEKVPAVQAASEKK
jgi:hypothetical protein